MSRMAFPLERSVKVSRSHRSAETLSTPEFGCTAHIRYVEQRLILALVITMVKTHRRLGEILKFFARYILPLTQTLPILHPAEIRVYAPPVVYLLPIERTERLPSGHKPHGRPDYSGRHDRGKTVEPGKGFCQRFEIFIGTLSGTEMEIVVEQI